MAVYGADPEEIEVGDQVEVEAEPADFLESLSEDPDEKMGVEFRGKVLEIRRGEDAGQNAEVFVVVEDWQTKDEVYGIAFDTEAAENVPAVTTNDGTVRYGVAVDVEGDPRGVVTRLVVDGK